MTAEIVSYTPVADDRAVNVVVALSEDTGALVETTTIIVPADNLSATFLVERVNSLLRTRVLAKQPMPTVAQLEALLPVGFKTRVPG
jgi:hypothetical protein